MTNYLIRSEKKAYNPGLCPIIYAMRLDAQHQCVQSIYVDSEDLR